MADAKKAQKNEEVHAAAPTEGEGAESTEGKSKFNAKKIILFGVLPLAVIIGLGAGAYFMGYLDKFLGHKKLQCETVKEGDEDFAACSKQAEEAEAKKGAGVFVDVPPMIINLSSIGKQQRYLKITVKVELENAEGQKAFEPLLPRVVDQFQTYLRELRLEDLKGSSGMYRMKLELLSRVRAAAPEVKVRDVLFQEILVQ